MVFSSLFPDSSSASRFTAGAFEIFMSSQSGGGSARNEWAESFINTSLSKLEHNSNHRPAADAKSGSEETSAPSRDCPYWFARARQRVREYISLGPLPCDTLY